MVLGIHQKVRGFSVICISVQTSVARNSVCMVILLYFKKKFPHVTILGPVHNKPEEFENAALFLRLSILYTVIPSRKWSFSKSSSNRRNLKTLAPLRFRVDGKRFENGAFCKRWRQDNHVISLPEFSLITKPK